MTDISFKLPPVAKALKKIYSPDFEPIHVKNTLSEDTAEFFREHLPDVYGSLFVTPVLSLERTPSDEYVYKLQVK